ncbi:hypothetical protein ABIC94_005130 [Variovorax paradoxus]|uniref:hypothetical protein n=1 Tax=Variovorax paradoxus TaxID=34073 RepID=UPI00339A55D3
MSSKRKIEEAAFFIELLHALQERSEPLTHLDDVDAEASFLYAAILNAFYSTVETMTHEGIDTKSFRAKYPEIYAFGSKGGERAKTVHLGHTEVAPTSYQPSTTLVFRRPARLVEERELATPAPRNSLIFKKEFYFYVELAGQNVHALQFCEEHMGELWAFHVAQST